jgi:predicted butyrate kinase (DUF1464 family)
VAVRVAGADPGTSSLDLLVLDDGRCADQHRFTPAELSADPGAVARWLEARGPFDLVAGPSGYGLPLVAARDCTEEHLRWMTLVRPDDADARGVAGFSGLLRALVASRLPVVFLPGVVHLDTVPPHRKLNRIDMGTPDKLCAAALAVALGHPAADGFCLVELGSAFTACVVVSGGRVVDGLGGTSGPAGWGSGGAWDGELAYRLSPLAKHDLFVGGVGALADRSLAVEALAEGVVKAVAGLAAVTPCAEVVLSGRLLETQPAAAAAVADRLARLARVTRLGSLDGAWVKHAAQGAAVLADGLAGGRWAGLVERMRLRQAAGTVVDGVVHPRAVSAGAAPAGAAHGASLRAE